MLLSIAALAVAATTGHAQVEHPVHWSVRGGLVTVAAGDTARVTLHATIGEFFHLYSTTQGPGGPMPTSVTLLPDGAAKLGTPATVNQYSLIGRVRSPAPDTIPDGNFGIMTEVYDDSVTLGITVRADPSLSPGRSEARAGVIYQACTSRYCLPPRQDTIPIAMVVAARGEHIVPAALPEIGAAIEPQSTPIALGNAGGPGAFLLLAASMGALALLTPCVFPMVPITVTSFLGAAGDRRRGVGRAALYALGIVGSFTGLGVLTSVVFGASGLARFAANPVVNLAIAALFIVFALSLLGVVQLAVPQAIVGRAVGALDSSAAGPLAMGALFTLTAFTCTAPFVGTLLVMASQGSWTWPLSGMLVFSTVFAAPFFLLALAPGLLRRRPRAGDWMPTLELVLGALELAAAIKFVSNADLVLGWGIFTRRVVLVLWLAIFAGLVFGMLRAPRAGRARLVAAAVALVIAATLLPGLFGRRLGELDAFLPPLASPRTNTAASNDELPWILNDYAGALAQARAGGTPVLVDFTGYTCTNCRWMEANMFPRDDVKRALGRFVRMRLYTDGLGEPYTSQQTLEQRLFGTVALPLYAIHDSTGRPRATFLGMTRDTREFLEFLSRGASAP